METLAHRRPLLVVLAAASLSAGPAGVPAQTEPTELDRAPLALDDPLPPDPSVIRGELENGIRYYIRENAEPRSRASLRFVVEAGSILEDEDQLGLAHVLEHMAFNGTERFEKREIVAFMESIGMRLGPGLNASTSFDATTYMLTVPTDDPANLDTAFRIMEDWAHALTLDPEEIEQERLVVIEEWRSGRGAGSRVSDRHNAVLFEGSPYASRLPIGTRESLESFDHDALRRFYRDWYRPDLMAVVAVGDFDAARVEALIRAHFAELVRPESPRPRVLHELPAREETLFSIVADPEVPTASVSVFHKLPAAPVRTVGDFRRRIVESLYDGMLTLRFQEIARRPDPPIRAARSSRGRLVRSASAYMLGAEVPEDGILRGLEVLVGEAERVARFGFTESELERAKTQLLRQSERRFESRDDRSSSRFAGEYVRAVLDGDAIPAIELEHALLERFLPEITVEEVNRAGREWIRDSSRVVLVTAPEKPGLELPDEEALTAVLDGVAEAELTRYVDSGADGVLLAEPLQGSEIVATREKPGGITEWELENGVRVVLKPTDFDQDDVRFSAFSPGGTSLAADDDVVPASTAADVIGAGGVGALDATALQKTLAGKLVRVDPYIAPAEEGVIGRASSRDLETLFELIYLRLTAPRADSDAFAAYTARQHQRLVNRERNPGMVFSDAFLRLVYQDHPRRQPMTVERLLEADLDRSFDFYAARFGDAGDFTFVFVGSFDLETMRPLVERYLGALPANGRRESARDRGVRFPRGVVEEVIREGREPRSRTQIAFAPREDLDWQGERTLMTAVTQVLESRLRDVLREELGATYGVGVGITSYMQPERRFAPAITFEADPERMEELVAAVFEEIAALGRDGPEERPVADARAAMLRSHETRLESNGAWLSALVESYRLDAEPGADAMLGERAAIEALTPAAIRDGARRYFDAEHYVRLTLLPAE